MSKSTRFAKISAVVCLRPECGDLRHALGVRSCRPGLRNALPGKDVADFSDADHLRAVLADRIRESLRGGLIEKSCRCDVRPKFPGSPVNGRAITRPMRYASA